MNDSRPTSLAQRSSKPDILNMLLYMEATTMLAISSLVKKLTRDYPALTFAHGQTAHWSSTEHTVWYTTDEPHADWVLLHETAHGLLRHANYAYDIELVRFEKDAWQYAVQTLAPRYNLVIDPDFIEAHLDTYRDWLHAKSTCPACQSSGYEARTRQYQCLQCGTSWRTNAGLTSRIRRRVTTTSPI